MNRILPFILAGWIVLSTFSCYKSAHSSEHISKEEDSSSIMSIDEAKKEMVTKLSDYELSLFVEKNSSTEGVIDSLVKKSLEENSIVSSLIRWFNPNEPPQNISLFGDEIPVDTLFLDDFEIDVDGNIGCRKAIISTVIYDRSWCSALSVP